VRRRDPHIFHTIGSQTAVKLTALHALPPSNEDSWYLFIYVWGWVDPKVIMRLSIEKPNDRIGNRTRDFAACSIVPQQRRYRISLPCSPFKLKVDRRFGGTCCLHLRCRKIKPIKKPVWKQTTNRAILSPASPACLLISHWFLARLIPRHWRRRQHVTPKCRFTFSFNGLHGAISWKIKVFITTGVTTSNSTTDLDWKEDKRAL
jgi:hypothetical protein